MGINNTKNIQSDDIIKYNYIKNTVLKDILPHVGDKYNNKCYFLGLMVNKLLKTHLGIYKTCVRCLCNQFSKFKGQDY